MTTSALAGRADQQDGGPCHPDDLPEGYHTATRGRSRRSSADGAVGCRPREPRGWAAPGRRDGTQDPRVRRESQRIRSGRRGAVVTSRESSAGRTTSDGPEWHRTARGAARNPRSHPNRSCGCVWLCSVRPDTRDSWSAQAADIAGTGVHCRKTRRVKGACQRALLGSAQIGPRLQIRRRLKCLRSMS